MHRGERTIPVILPGHLVHRRVHSDRVGPQRAPHVHPRVPHDLQHRLLRPQPEARRLDVAVLPPAPRWALRGGDRSLCGRMVARHAVNRPHRVPARARSNRPHRVCGSD
eukprot:716822-Rhodomonas_salina.1